jgi:hypothetical protein
LRGYRSAYVTRVRARTKRRGSVTCQSRGHGAAHLRHSFFLLDHDRNSDERNSMDDSDGSWERRRLAEAVGVLRCQLCQPSALSRSGSVHSQPPLTTTSRPAGPLMPLVTTPLVDEHNPCYCPTTSARVYLDRLRAKRSPALSPDALYADALHGSLAFDLRSDFDLHPDFPLASSSPRRSFAILDGSFTTLTSLSPSSGSSSGSSGLSPPVHARSSLVIDDASYELDGRASPIPTFFPAHTGHSPSSPPTPAPALTRVLEGTTYVSSAHHTHSIPYPPCNLTRHRCAVRPAPRTRDARRAACAHCPPLRAPARHSSARPLAWTPEDLPPEDSRRSRCRWYESHVSTTGSG